MLNFTLTITAAPELLAAVTGLTNSINAAKVDSIQKINSDPTAVGTLKDQISAAALANQAASQTASNQLQYPSAQYAIPVQDQAQRQIQINNPNTYNQLQTVPVNQCNSQVATGSVYPVQAQHSTNNQVSSTQGSIVPTSAQTYTLEQLAIAATQLVDGGRRVELVKLLNSFGAQALTALPKDQYGVFATQLRALGAKI